MMNIFTIIVLLSSYMQLSAMQQFPDMQNFSLALENDSLYGIPGEKECQDWLTQALNCQAEVIAQAEKSVQFSQSCPSVPSVSQKLDDDVPLSSEVILKLIAEKQRALEQTKKRSLDTRNEEDYSPHVSHVQRDSEEKGKKPRQHTVSLGELSHFLNNFQQQSQLQQPQQKEKSEVPVQKTNNNLKNNLYALSLLLPTGYCSDDVLQTHPFLTLKVPHMEYLSLYYLFLKFYLLSYMK